MPEHADPPSCPSSNCSHIPVPVPRACRLIMGITPGSARGCHAHSLRACPIDRGSFVRDAALPGPAPPLGASPVCWMFGVSFHSQIVKVKARLQQLIGRRVMDVG